jgi:histidinol-phosphate aminotransferase
MRKRSIERAVVLAAGRGSRLVSGETYPKPLKLVAGSPLLARILRTLASEGVREAVIVVGYQGDQIRQALADDPTLGLALTFVENTRWEQSNGVSLLAAADYVDQDCILTMADHLFAPEIVRRLVRAELPAGACALAVDYDIERCFDLDDATKVQVENNRIARIAKDLEVYNAIDTGVFRIGPALIEQLARIDAQRGDASLSDGVRALAQRGLFLATDAGDSRWIDVDTPEAHARGEAMVRLFGDALGDEPAGTPVLDPEAMDQFAPSWVRGAAPYREDHFAVADARAPRAGASRSRPIARLMSNESPFEPSPRVVEAVVAALSRGHLYPDAALSGELRRRLAGRTELGEECCVLGAGSSEIIDLTVRSFVAPGEEVVIAVPTFSMYESRTRVAGGVPVLVPMTDALELDARAVVGAVTERTKLIFLCTPNNPTGLRPSDADIRRILRLGLPTVIDEAYGDFDDDDPSGAELIHEYPNAIVIRTFSKAFGLAGLRIGYALASAPVARLMARVKLPWNVSVVALAAALAALDDTEEYARRRGVLRSQRRYMASEFRKMPGVEVHGAEGNFLLLDIHETGVSADALVQSMLAEGVLIRSLASHHLRRGYVRVSVGAPDENRRCVEALRRGLGRMQLSSVRPLA